MIEAPSQVRDAIAQTHAEIAESIHALREKVDAISGEADHVRRAATQATTRVADLGQHAIGSVADLGQHAIGSAASQFKATTSRQRVLLPILLAAGLAGIVAVLFAKRRRAATEELPEWEAPDS
jgi:hypothetical protein